MKKCLLIISAIGLFLITSLQTTQAQDNKAKFDFGSDFVSRYNWRGFDFGNSPAIQPFMSFSVAGFEIGAWTSYTTNSNNFQEIDLYTSYTFWKDMISIGATDYFIPNGVSVGNNYFEWSEDSTQHFLEANFNFNGTEKVPITFSVNFFFYGADPDNSVYLELGHFGTFKKAIDYEVFIGATTGKGMYLPEGTTGFSVVNLGFGLSKDIQITEKWALPVFAKLITNPQAQNIWLVFGFSL